MGRLRRIFALFCCCCCESLILSLTEKDTDRNILLVCATEPLGDGSEFRNPPQADPREKDIDEEFMARNYTWDATGRFHTTPTPSTLLEPKPSPPMDHNVPMIPILKVDSPTDTPEGLPRTTS